MLDARRNEGINEILLKNLKSLNKISLRSHKTFEEVELTGAGEGKASQRDVGLEG